jgi:TIR domain
MARDAGQQPRRRVGNAYRNARTTITGAPRRVARPRGVVVRSTPPPAAGPQAASPDGVTAPSPGRQGRRRHRPALPSQDFDPRVVGLSTLRRQCEIAEWHDRQIVAGSDWARDIDAHLDSADVVLLLLSADFIASDYCWGVEMRRALERHGSGEAVVIPVILRPVDVRPSRRSTTSGGGYRSAFRAHPAGPEFGKVDGGRSPHLRLPLRHRLQAVPGA